MRMPATAQTWLRRARTGHRPLRDVVVVTGAHRSGTTVMGAMLNECPDTFVVHEPFNMEWGIEGVPLRYPYMTWRDANTQQSRALRTYLMTGEAVWKSRGRFVPPWIERAKEHRRAITVLRASGHTAIVKDPFLLLALGWINHALSDRPVVVTLRHPASWVSSLLRRQMHPRSVLASLRSQDACGDPVVRDLLAARQWEDDDIVGSGAATWACLTRMLEVQLDAGADALVVRMEDFAREPRRMFGEILEATRLRPPADVDAVVEHYTGSQNIVSPDPTVMHHLRRNSAALAEAWRNKLSLAEQARIREVCEPHAGRWYSRW